MVIQQGRTVRSLDQENFFAQALITAEDVAGLEKVAHELRRRLRVTVTGIVEALKPVSKSVVTE